MKTNQTIYLLIILFVLSVNCKSDKKSNSEVKEILIEKIEDKPKTIEIVTRSMEFQCADTILSGWNTFRYDNRANETHFFRFIKLPEGITLINYKNEIDPVFEEGMDLINDGKTAEGFKAFEKLPEWFGKCVPSGGSGLIAPKHQTLIAFSLNPGAYVMECYVKMPNGKFHSTMGMVKQVYVAKENSGNKPPKPTDTINIKDDGFHFNSDIRSGKHIFKVNVINQKLHENFATSDVHLVKLESTADINELEKWMVWYDPKGFITPVPHGITFLGGFNDAIEGSTGYFYTDLKPGNYAFISEVPNALKKGLFKPFTVLD